MTVSIEYEAERKLSLPYEEIIEEIVLESLDYEKCPYEAEAVSYTHLQIRRSDQFALRQVGQVVPI